MTHRTSQEFKAAAVWATLLGVPGLTPTELPPIVTTGSTSSLCPVCPGQICCWPNLVLCNLAVSRASGVLLHLPRLDRGPWLTTGRSFPSVVGGNRETAGGHEVRERAQGSGEPLPTMESARFCPHSLGREQVLTGDGIPVVQSLLPADSHI